MIEFLSYVLNVILASGLINNRGADIDKYHEAIELLKKKICQISLDANSGLGLEMAADRSNMQRQIVAEFHHLISECQNYGRNYKNFVYDGLVSQSLNDFRKSATGAGNKTIEARGEEINVSSVAFLRALESCKIAKKWQYAFFFWNKI